MLDFREYAVIPVWYGCNSRCTICMLDGIRSRLTTVAFAQFKRLVAALMAEGRYHNLILSGAEVTTFPHVEEYVRHAASPGWFKKIQIQTNGRRLADRACLTGLLDAGVNEFFISVHGSQEVHEAITRIPGSYAATMTGITNLAAYPVTVVTNTVVTNANVPWLADVIRELCLQPQISELHLWNYFPMARHDRHGLVTRLPKLVALLPELAELATNAGKQLVLKGFPECLVVGDGCLVDSFFPANLIQDEFWGAFAENGFGCCCHRAVCSAANRCWGLSQAYISRYGDERTLLTPLKEEP